jgi:hypothetical protein
MIGRLYSRRFFDYHLRFLISTCCDTMFKTTLISTVLVIPFHPSLFAEQSCLTNSFYGSFNGQSVFNMNPPCFEAGLPSFLDSGTIIPAFRPVQQLVWVQEQAVDEALWNRENTTSERALDRLFSRLEAPLTNSRAYGEQQIFIASETNKSYEILYRTSSSALLSLNSHAARAIDTLLPPFYKSTLLPTSPISYVPVPEGKVRVVKDILSSLRFDPVVASIVNAISIPQMKRDIRYLTGEDEESPIVSRHSFAAGSGAAAAWLKERFEATGAICELKEFLVGFAPNVIWYGYPPSYIPRLVS